MDHGTKQKPGWGGAPALAVLMGLGLASLVAAAPVALLGHYHTDQAGDGKVTTTAGLAVNVAYEPQTRALYAFTTARGGRPAPLADGTYRLTNGGAIRVQEGRIVWDAFGVVDKLAKGAPVQHPGNNNG
ncbi:MAG: hypothetical protein JO127_00745 [Caulobacteraceae bacterium]|nr:hypothetical protein [Caulobacteraceae bacterium]